MTSWNWNSAGGIEVFVWLSLGLNSFFQPQPQFIILWVGTLTHCPLASIISFNINVLFLLPDSEFFVNWVGLIYVGIPRA